VVLDPGRSGGPNFDSTAEVDGPKPVTGLGIKFHPVDIDDSGIMSIDNGGAPGERVTMWRAALRIRTILRSAGYAVDLTKSSANENVGLLERVREAIDDHATIAVSLHYSGGIPFGEANAHFGVTPQQVGRYRTNVTNGDTIRFTNARVAAESQRDAKIIQKAGAVSRRSWNAVAESCERVRDRCFVARMRTRPKGRAALRERLGRAALDRPREPSLFEEQARRIDCWRVRVRTVPALRGWMCDLEGAGAC
jgi:N-acetylmuramoyl-L-alanine amidase